MTTRLKVVLWSWLPVLLWLCIIFVESTNLLSSTNTGSALYWVLTRLFGPISHHKFDVFHAILRKSGHFVGYGVLGLLFFRAIRNSVVQFSSAVSLTTNSLGHSALRWATEAVLCTAVVASLDEWHQRFLPARTGAIHDVVLDICGAIVLVTFAIITSRTLRSSVTE
jgi:VanZ family protein